MASRSVLITCICGERQWELVKIFEFCCVVIVAIDSHAMELLRYECRGIQDISVQRVDDVCHAVVGGGRCITEWLCAL